VVPCRKSRFPRWRQATRMPREDLTAPEFHKALLSGAVAFSELFDHPDVAIHVPASDGDMTPIGGGQS